MHHAGVGHELVILHQLGHQAGRQLAAVVGHHAVLVTVGLGTGQWRSGGRSVELQGWCGILIFDKYTYLASF